MINLNDSNVIFDPDPGGVDGPLSRVAAHIYLRMGMGFGLNKLKQIDDTDLELLVNILMDILEKNKSVKFPGMLNMENPDDYISPGKTNPEYHC